ncbi:anaerobic ribonucleoside-triphosphate reductase activating protein [Gallaecimonas sp. GXIMD4217]|uniref:anaerobic ribonucleoside-triphosphate reductase activating protein n=1 Tax=Gallaecimonas sp. GXIMD4217 TaxID=3131927 RepID=UPI00311AC4A9
MTETALVISGVTPFTTLDYPAHLSAVVWCQGCPWRCRYCHNPELLCGKPEQQLDWQDIRAWLQERTGLLDAVVFSGGEASLQPGLAQAMAEVKALGFKVGLHSAGVSPKHLEPLLKLVDWLGLDIKALPADLDGIIGKPGQGDRHWQCLDLALQSGVDFEVRTTWHGELMPVAALKMLMKSLAARGVRHHALQLVRPGQMLDPGLGRPNVSETTLAALTALGLSLFPHFELRR